MLTSFLRPDAPDAASKRDEELRYCIDNRERYLPESVLTAMAELQSRGIEFSEEETKVIQEDMQAREDIAANSKMGYGSLFNDGYKDCLVQDPDAYSFYSKRVIKGFTFFFGVFFGSILMAINLGKTKNQAGMLLVLLFGTGLSVIEVAIAKNAHLGSAINILFALVNTALMEFLFWNRYIGKVALYSARSYRTPLSIALILVVFILIAIIKSGV
jgi:hypothetical protein